MRVKLLIAFVALFFVFLLSGCEELLNNPQLGDFEIWKNSDLAEDLNDDRKINEDDYAIYLDSIIMDYETWKDSEVAEDLNGDRKINEEDYAIYLNPVASEYEVWKDSDAALDMNGDRKIDEDDYALFLAVEEFVGTYHIVNYQFVGTATVILETDLKLQDMATVLEGITLEVNEAGEISANISSETIAAFGNQFAVIVEGLNQMTLERISQFIIAIDTTVTIDNVIVNVTLYLTEIENGYRTSYQITSNNIDSIISFDIIRDEN
jgi:hypothetical protein